MNIIVTLSLNKGFTVMNGLLSEIRFLHTCFYHKSGNVFGESHYYVLNKKSVKSL